MAQNRQFSPQQFERDKERFIIREAKLSPDEAKKFFQLYKECQEKMRTYFDRNKKLSENKPSSEKEIVKNIQERDRLEIEMKKLQQQYHNKYLKVLPASKVYDALNAEDKFHRHMFRNSAKKANRGGRDKKSTSQGR